MDTRENEWGVWKVGKGKHCNIETLIKPSDAFRQFQEAQPEPSPKRNILAEVDELKAKVEKLGKK